MFLATQIKIVSKTTGKKVKSRLNDKSNPLPDDIVVRAGRCQQNTECSLLIYRRRRKRRDKSDMAAVPAVATGAGGGVRVLNVLMTLLSLGSSTTLQWW